MLMGRYFLREKQMGPFYKCPVVCILPVACTRKVVDLKYTSVHNDV